MKPLGGTITETSESDPGSQQQNTGSKCCKPQKFRWRYWLPRIILGFCIMLVGLLAIGNYEWLKVQLHDFLQWIADHPIGSPFVCFLTTILAVVLLGPYSLIATGAGYAFSRAFHSTWAVLAVGTFTVFFGAWIGATIAFFLGRYLCRKQVKKLVKKSLLLKAVD